MTKLDAYLGIEKGVHTTPRGKVTVRLGSLVDCTLERVEDLFREAKARAEREQIFDLRIDVGYDKGYYGDVDPYANIEGTRYETEEEWTIRERNETYGDRMREEKERQQYERLKAKFES